MYGHSIIRESEDQMDKVNISTITITSINNSNQNWSLCSVRYMCLILIHSSPHMIYEKISLTTFYGHKQTTFMVLNNLSKFMQLVYLEYARPLDLKIEFPPQF